MHRIRAMAVAALLLAMSAPAFDELATPAGDSEAAVVAFLNLLAGEPTAAGAALAFIDAEWRESFVPLALDSVRLSNNQFVTIMLVQMLQTKTGQSFGYDLNQWYAWLWQREPRVHPHYATFKRTLYGLIDPRFEAYFAPDRPAAIRLDEVVWGGVTQDGIPPLRHPKMIPAAEAEYLENDHVVFGIALNGDARAYPKRILGWHELFVDEVGDVPVAGVYCTLCGTMILYRSEHAGVKHELGTSGFLYRSNKLMYDKATSSLWSTLWGKPVLGPLVGQDIALERLSVVTSTWAEWRKRHPDTTVLSLDTGHVRDYGEGQAYRDYYADDELMFAVPVLDARLRNKDEVLGLVFAQHPNQALAIAAQYLNDHPVHHDRLGSLDLVVLTDSSGANRVYESEGVTFVDWDRDRSVQDATGAVWALSESALTGPGGRELRRLPAHRAFWFGWYSAYSHTRLVH